MKRVIYIIKKVYYRITRQGSKLAKLKADRLRSRGAEIGENLKLFADISTSEAYLIEIGNNVTIAANVSILTHDNSVSKMIAGTTDGFGKVKIGNNCFIGFGALILPGVELGDDVIVGAGSVVTKSFKKGNVVIGGNPAKAICTTEEYVEKNRPYAINIKGLSYEDKKKMILDNNDVKMYNK